ncbi:hypothetical protein [Prochlorococcus sp. MIT 1323]|uniref:hypothetical protein n=1 Tax=Prochlorococcus sp. MIT 1323 TaxID=3082526 RepID=UPI0039B5189B
MSQKWTSHGHTSNRWWWRCLQLDSLFRMPVLRARPPWRAFDGTEGFTAGRSLDTARYIDCEGLQPPVF